MLRRLSILMLLAAVGLWLSRAEAQESNPQPASRVNLGSAAGAPGTRLSVPLYFTAAPGVQAGKLSLAIRYVSNSLKFEKFQAALDAELDGIQFQSGVTDSRNDKGLSEQVLKITALAGEGKKPIPSGLIGYIEYAIGESGKAATITLHNSAEGVEMNGMPIGTLKVFNAEVEIQLPGSPPEVICFFFTH